MKKIFLKIGVFLFVIMTVISYRLSNNHNENISLENILVMSHAQAEDGYPIGQYCGSDKCTVSVGIPPYVVTGEGSYWHCKWQDLPGVCLDALCDKPCDANP
jgi:hypothetical protein